MLNGVKPWGERAAEMDRGERQRGWNRRETEGEEGFVCTGNSPRTARAHLGSGEVLFNEVVVEAIET